MSKDASELKDTRMTGQAESSQRNLRDGFARLGGEQGLDEYEDQTHEEISDESG